MLQEAVRLRRNDFYQKFDEELGHRPERKVLIFVHGYNVDFHAAVLRTAQLAFDLQYQGLPLLFTWPSKGKTSGYLADEATSEWSIPSFEALLDTLWERTAAERYEIVAHSMGARIVASALAHLREAGRLPEAAHVSELVLAAPDIDAGVFRQLQRKLAGGIDRDIHAWCWTLDDVVGGVREDGGEGIGFLLARMRPGSDAPVTLFRNSDGGWIVRATKHAMSAFSAAC